MGVPTRDNLILLVEDDENVVKLFTLFLREAGYDVAAVTSGEEALNAAVVLDPAAIILDLLLPAMDGWEVLAALKASLLTRHIPVLIVSVLDRQQLGFHLGAVEHLVKPVDRGHLLRALERTLLRRRFRERAPRVLVVHDQEDELAILATVLSQEGYEVIAARGCSEGIAMARTLGPDLAVLDLMLAELDSFQVITSLRADTLTAQIPILLITHRGLPLPERRLLTEQIRSIVIQGEISEHVLLQNVGHLLLEARR